MKENRLSGYDLNGWRDIAARQWIVRPGDEVEFGGTHLSEGGVLSSVVRAGDGDRERWIGGIQADLAPHGRGGGWGQVGAADRRLSVRDLLVNDAASPIYLAAALSGLVRDPTHCVVAIDDAPSTTEGRQEQMLQAISMARLGKGLLVWRLVLAALFVLEHQDDRSKLTDGVTVGIVGQTNDGFYLQTLRLRQEAGRSRTLLAPERRMAGRTFGSALGYAALVDRARALIAREQPAPALECLKGARAIGRLALGLPTAAEMLRLPNGDWMEVTPPAELDLPPFDFSGEHFADLKQCEVIVFETLSEGRMRAQLFGRIEAALGRQVMLLPASCIAEGALIAAGRLAANDPVYFDFLPRIATIVQGANGAANYDLIHADETLPAGRLYRSPQPAKLAIQAGQSQFAVHVRKETQRWPRKAIVEIGSPVSETTPVDLWVEQSPAAGRAKILMQAPALSRQFVVDWEAATVIEQDWDEIINALALRLPTIPERLVLPCGMQPWEDSNRGPGLVSLLSANATRRHVDWNALATQLNARPEGRYCISSDGDLPAKAPQESVLQLGDLTRQAEAHFFKRLKGKAKGGNQSIRFLTWQFRRCPEHVAVALLELMQKGPPYQLFQGSPGIKLLFQGLGRVIRSERLEKETLHALLDRNTSNWKWYSECACMAFLLSRSDTAPTFLARKDVEHISAIVQRDFKANLGTEYTKFYYAPFLLVGLLRWRLKEPRALVVNHDKVATALSKTVSRAIEDLKGRRHRTPRFDRTASRYVPILEDILDELQGEGSNPELLLDIYGQGDE